MKFMKSLVKINLLILIAIIVVNTSHAQQRASDKSFNSVLNEVKQKQAMRNKMLSQMTQTMPDASQNGTTAERTNTIGAAQQTTVPVTGTSEQSASHASSSKPVQVPVRSKLSKEGKL